MTRLAYFDLASGVSGDMAIAAMVHAGRKLPVDVESVVRSAIGSLGLGCAVEFIDDVRGGIACLRVEIKDTGARYTASELRNAIACAEAPDDARTRALRGFDALIEETLDRLAARCADLDEKDVVQTAPVIDLLQAGHDRLYSRLFQS